MDTNQRKFRPLQITPFPGASATVFHSINPEQINELFSGLQNQINDLKENLQPKQPSEYLTREEVADMLKVNLSTIHNWCKLKKLRRYGIHGRVYFLRSEIEKALLPLDDHE